MHQYLHILDGNFQVGQVHVRNAGGGVNRTVAYRKNIGEWIADDGLVGRYGRQGSPIFQRRTKVLTITKEPPTLVD